MSRLMDALLKGDVQIVFLDNDHHEHCAHVNAAWEAIRAAGIPIPYMCSYAVRAGAATHALLNGLAEFNARQK
ncbi:hypothetical protein [Paraburkholderia sp. BCC1886]|uniref:hypothetical protein n=1 Tax=Paraburkholderia sp. BCC1886 TaxID=2562670 RepID=UPI0011839B28|nr:hypothetical protein [Paraburkholderia sp. BCC1886]